MKLVTLAEVRRRTENGAHPPVLSACELLSPSARDYLSACRLSVCAEKTCEQPKKAEWQTHLDAGHLVSKTHPRIRFRGMIDRLEAEILLAAFCTRREGNRELTDQLTEILDYVRRFMRYDVKGEPVDRPVLCGMTEDELRECSHYPERYYGQPHFMASPEDGEVLLRLNLVRTMVRQTELAALEAWPPEGENSRPDIHRALNRLSSLFWILMIREKAKGNGGEV